jgi:hypothetical protein
MAPHRVRLILAKHFIKELAYASLRYLVILRISTIAWRSTCSVKCLGMARFALLLQVTYKTISLIWKQFG